MKRGIRYEILNELKQEYGISLSNNQFKSIVSDHYRKTYNAKQLYSLLLKYSGGFPVRTGIMILKPGKTRIKIQ